MEGATAMGHEVEIPSALVLSQHCREGGQGKLGHRSLPWGPVSLRAHADNLWSLGKSAGSRTSREVTEAAGHRFG